MQPVRQAIQLYALNIHTKWYELHCRTPYLNSNSRFSPGSLLFAMCWWPTSPLFSFLLLHFSRIGLNMTIRGEKPSCCPEWSILILWPSERRLKVLSLSLHNQMSSYCWLGYGTDNVALFVQLMTSCVLSWSTAVEETCSRGFCSRKIQSSALMMYSRPRLPAAILAMWSNCFL